MCITEKLSKYESSKDCFIFTFSGFKEISYEYKYNDIILSVILYLYK